jgi:hypothetical protein
MNVNDDLDEKIDEELMIGQDDDNDEGLIEETEEEKIEIPKQTIDVLRSLEKSAPSIFNSSCKDMGIDPDSFSKIYGSNENKRKVESISIDKTEEVKDVSDIIVKPINLNEKMDIIAKEEIKGNELIIVNEKDESNEKIEQSHKKAKLSKILTKDNENNPVIDESVSISIEKTTVTKDKLAIKVMDPYKSSTIEIREYIMGIVKESKDKRSTIIKISKMIYKLCLAFRDRALAVQVDSATGKTMLYKSEYTYEDFRDTFKIQGDGIMEMKSIVFSFIPVVYILSKMSKDSISIKWLTFEYFSVFDEIYSIVEYKDWIFNMIFKKYKSAVSMKNKDDKTIKIRVYKRLQDLRTRVKGDTRMYFYFMQLQNMEQMSSKDITQMIVYMIAGNKEEKKGDSKLRSLSRK